MDPTTLPIWLKLQVLILSWSLPMTNQFQVVHSDLRPYQVPQPTNVTCIWPNSSAKCCTNDWKSNEFCSWYFTWLLELVHALSVKAVGPRGTQAQVYPAKGNKRGLYNIALNPIRPGKYRVSVKWSEDHIPGSPFMLKVYPGADASKCKAYGSGLKDGLVGQPINS